MDDFPTSLLEDHNFILAMAKYADGLMTESAIKKRWTCRRRPRLPGSRAVQLGERRYILDEARWSAPDRKYFPRPVALAGATDAVHIC
jgi:hypothetical protein